MNCFLSRMKIRYGKFMAVVSLLHPFVVSRHRHGSKSRKAPAVGQAVQGQQATQVEGTVLNAVNWICNVICPVIAAGCFVAAAFKYQANRPYMSSIVGGGIFLAVSAVTRLIEYFIAQGQQVGGSLHQLPIFTNHPAVAVLHHFVRNV